MILKCTGGHFKIDLAKRYNQYCNEKWERSFKKKKQKSILQISLHLINLDAFHQQKSYY